MSKENLSFPEKCHNKAKQNKWDSAWRKNEKKTNKQKQNKTTRQRSAEEKLIRKHVFSTMDREISLTGQISYSPWRWRCVFACLFVSVCVCVGGGEGVWETGRESCLHPSRMRHTEISPGFRMVKMHHSKCLYFSNIVRAYQHYAL